MTTATNWAIDIKLVYFAGSKFDEDGQFCPTSASWEILVKKEEVYLPLLNVVSAQTRVMQDLPEWGYAVASLMPTTSNPYCTTVQLDLPELGWAIALPLRKDTLCHGCKWLTGEHFLPCAINPMAFGQGCSDYES